MKRVLVFLAIYTGSLALMVVLLAVALLIWIHTSGATGVAFTSGSIPALLLIMLLVAIFAGWLTRRLLRSKAAAIP